MSDRRLIPLSTHPHSWRRAVWPAFLKWLKATDWPILVGPWYGEIGFEVLYWIPFLEQLKAHGIAPERLIPISRGGAAAWYGTPTGLELYAMRTPQQVRIENRLLSLRTGLMKQTSVTAWDRAVLKDAADTLGLTHYHVLHPAWMYHLMAPFWTGLTGVSWLTKRAQYPVMPTAPLPGDLTLPEPFVAAKFYGRDTWEFSDKTVRAASAATLLRLAEQSPVILLQSGFLADDHGDLPIPKHPNLIPLSSLTPLRPETNLAVQSAVVARAQGFVGTYGGSAQMALRLGKPSMSFYHQWRGTAITHRTLSELLSINTNTPFMMAKLGEIPLMLSVLPDAAIQPPGKTLDTSDKTNLVPV